MAACLWIIAFCCSLGIASGGGGSGLLIGQVGTLPIALIKGQHVNTNKYDGHIWKFKKFKYMNIRGSLSLNTNKDLLEDVGWDRLYFKWQLSSFDFGRPVKCTLACERCKKQIITLIQDGKLSNCPTTITD